MQKAVDIRRILPLLTSLSVKVLDSTAATSDSMRPFAY